MFHKKSAVSLMAALTMPTGAFAANSVTASAQPPAESSATSEIPRGPRYKASFTYRTSHSSSTDVRSFRSSATDDSGQVTEGSALPNLNYFSTRLSVSPWNRHTFSIGDLQSLDSEGKRTITRPGGGAFPLPSSIWSVRYGYRINDHFNAGLSETYITGRKFTDPMAGLNYRSNYIGDQGLAHRVGLNLSAPTTERSHNDQLITRATLRTSLAYVAGPWTTSAGIAYSRPFFAHPSRLAASNFGDPNAPPGSPQSMARPGGSGFGSHGNHGKAGHVASTDGTDTSSTIPLLEDADIALQERESNRTTCSFGVSFEPNHHWRLSSGAGVTYLQTWRQKTIWLTNARAITAAYDFWKMEIGSDISLYSDIHKFRHPSLPSLLSIGIHMSYFMGAERQAQL